MTRARTPTVCDTGNRQQSARRVALRAELFRQFFLPPPEEITDPSWLSRLSVPIDLSLALPPDSERRRIARDRARVARFRAVNHQQRQLRCLGLELFDYMARELLGPRDVAALEQWWNAARAYVRVLRLPVMATPRARTLLPRIIDQPWPEVERAAASLVRRWGQATPSTSRRRGRLRMTHQPNQRRLT